jgi:hypothetical protein
VRAFILWAEITAIVGLILILIGAIGIGLNLGDEE